MKRLLLLIIAIVFCNPSIYAKFKTVEYKYKSKGRPYMTVIGNFDKGILVDGKVSIAVVYIETTIIKGNMKKGK